MADPQATPGDAAPPNLVQFSIDRIYVKDLSLENPGAPQSFQIGDPPAVEIGLRTRTDQLDTDVYETVLTVTVTAKSGEATVDEPLRLMA